MRYWLINLTILAVWVVGSATVWADGKVSSSQLQQQAEASAPIVALVKGVVEVKVPGADEKAPVLFVKYTNVAFVITSRTQFGAGFENLGSTTAAELSTALKDKRVLIYWQRNANGVFEAVRVEDASKVQIPQQAKFVDRPIQPKRYPLKDRAKFKGLTNGSGSSGAVEKRVEKVYNGK